MLKGDPNKRPKNKYCCFHRDHKHNTSECYDLKQQIEAFIKQGKLQRFIRGGENLPRDPDPNQRVKERPRALFGEIKVIVRGSVMASSFKKTRKTYLWMVQSVQIFGRPPKMTRVDNPAISFTEEDSRQLHHPHDDTLVINLSIVDFNTRRKHPLLPCIPVDKDRQEASPTFKHTASRIWQYQGLPRWDYHPTSDHRNISSVAH